MPKIDVSRIEGYDSMTAEQKLAALEAFEYSDNAEELGKLKNALSKSNSEAAEWRKKHDALLTGEQLEKQKSEQALEDMKKELEELRREKTVASYKARFLAMGYDEALAEKTAAAYADGDSETVFGSQKAFLESYEKKVKAQLLAGGSKPPSGQPPKDYDSMSDDEYYRSTYEASKKGQ